jgi:hypothetical protein
VNNQVSPNFLFRIVGSNSCYWKGHFSPYRLFSFILGLFLLIPKSFSFGYFNGAFFTMFSNMKSRFSKEGKEGNINYIACFRLNVRMELEMEKT